MPVGVACTRPSARGQRPSPIVSAAAACAAAGAEGRGEPGASRGPGRRRRRATSSVPAPRSSRAWAAAAPAPPAPSSDDPVRARPRAARAAGRGRSRTSRCCGRPRARPSNTTVLTAPIAAASGESSSRWAQDLLLAGVGDVEAAAALGAGPARRSPTSSGAQAQHVEVDQRVAVAQAERAGLALVQRGRERRADARADQADVHGAAGRRRRLTDRTGVSCTGPVHHPAGSGASGRGPRRPRLGAVSRARPGGFRRWHGCPVGADAPRRRTHPRRHPRRRHPRVRRPRATPAPGSTRSPPAPARRSG